jgi:A/G-specific adenine glycosylase
MDHSQLVPLAASAPALRSALLRWWEANGRHWIPWKLRLDGRRPEPGEPLCPFRTWIAEVMLQQTQLQVALPYWQRWMETLPDLETLAAADGQTLLRLWQGLGYYSRATRLKEGARLLLAAQAERGGTDPWPRTLAGWMALPGIGRSTAGGILSSAFDLPAPLLDGNVRRVLARLMAHPHPPRAQERLFWTWSEGLLDPHHPRAFNQALMDLGATVCTPRRPRCSTCPWQPVCGAYAGGDPSRYPVKELARPVPYQVIGVGVVQDDRGRVLIDQRLEEGLLGGLWEFPGGKQEPDEPIAETIRRELREELAIEADVGEELITLEHAYSHKRLRFVVHLCRWRSGDPQPLASQQVRWVAPAELERYPFPAANARIIAALLARLGVGGH